MKRLSHAERAEMNTSRRKMWLAGLTKGIGTLASATVAALSGGDPSTYKTWDWVIKILGLIGTVSGGTSLYQDQSVAWHEIEKKGLLPPPPPNGGGVQQGVQEPAGPDGIGATGV